MSDQNAPAPAGPTIGGMPIEDPAALTNALMAACRTCAQRATSGGEDGRDVKDNATAALALAQALITLDPTRLQGGDTPEARAAAAPRLPATSDGDHDGVVGS